MLNLADTFLREGGRPDELQELLCACMDDGSIDALVAVRRLFEEVYDEIEYKAPAAWTLVYWRQQGIDALVRTTLHDLTPKNSRFCVHVLCTLAAGFPEEIRNSLCPTTIISRVRAAYRQDPEVPAYASAGLRELCLSIGEDDLVTLLGHAFTQIFFEDSVIAQELVRAVSARWLAINKPILSAYERLIEDRPRDEAAFQHFFTKCPQFLEPMAAEVWPIPNIRGAKIPDFVLRRFDDTYLIVEIKTPDKLLVTKANSISADATGAVSQVTDYLHFIQRLPDVSRHFPNMNDVSCLVVVGLERSLNDRQAQALQNANLQHHSLRIVGFDWLAARAAAINENLIRNAVDVRNLRIL